MLEDFKAQSPARRFSALVIGAVSLVLVVVAERDIQHRSDAEVRGSKLLWRIVCLNALGALGYLRWGRRAS